MAESKQHKSNPIDQGAINDLFGPKRDSLFTSKQVNKSTKKQVYKRATYHLLPGSIKDLKVIAFFENKDISELVRNIISEYLERNKDKLKEYKSKLVNK